jgi:ribosomal protein L11 methyltransferase
MQEQWATFTLDLGRNPPSEDLESRRDALAALLAEDDDVSGVEVRDGTTLGGTSDTLQLIVYTAPAALDGLRPRIDRLAAALDLTLDVEAEVRDDDDWRDSWKQFYAPIVLGDGALLLRPSWIPRRPGDPEREIVLDPGRAFGTGQHESTRLCLDLVCGLADRSPAQVLDLGCGSGILAIAAARLFPTTRRIVAVDVDPEATATTTENAELNDVTSIEVVTGTVDDVDGRFDLIFANIRPSVLIPGAAAIAGHLAPGGDLLVSGVLIEEGAEVSAAYVAAGLAVVGSLEAGDWVALHLRGAT